MSNAYFIDILYFNYICGTHSNMLVFIKTAALQDASRGKQGLGGFVKHFLVLTVVHIRTDIDPTEAHIVVL